jgi:hypothetical protein
VIGAWLLRPASTPLDIQHEFAFGGLTDVRRTFFDFPPLAQGGYLCAVYDTVAKVNNPLRAPSPVEPFGR